MFDDKNTNMLGAIISTRAHNEAIKQAQGELDAIAADLGEALGKIGITMAAMPSAYEMLSKARNSRVDALVHARLQAVADALMAPVDVRETVSGNAREMRYALGQIVRNTQRTADYLDNVTDGGSAIRTQA